MESIDTMGIMKTGMFGNQVQNQELINRFRRMGMTQAMIQAVLGIGTTPRAPVENFDGTLPDGVSFANAPGVSVNYANNPITHGGGASITENQQASPFSSSLSARRQGWGGSLIFV